MINILADQDLPFVKDYFADLARVQLMPGRKIDAAAVKDADVLLVRSITTVNQALLADSSVRAVGSMTAGSDHLDTAWMDEHQIKWHVAAGFNAPPVADYIVSLVAGLMRCRLLCQQQPRAAVVGVGHVGKLVVSHLQLLDFEVVLCDPLRAAREPDFPHTPFHDISNVDLITFHVPLNHQGPDATYHMANETFLSQQKAGCVLINASRGAVIDTNLLKQHSARLHCCLDVWENEPAIDQVLLQQVLLATPHIAGYSVQSKQRGMQMLYQFVCKTGLIDCPPTKLKAYSIQTLQLADHIDHWQDAVLAVFNPLIMTNLMRHQILQDESGQAFDAMRQQFNYRHELGYTRLANHRFKGEDASILQQLGVLLD